MSYLYTDLNSSLIKEIEYYPESESCIIDFQKDDYPVIGGTGVYKLSQKQFNEFISAKSIGSYYLQNIANQPRRLKATDELEGANRANMANGQNKSSSSKRFIDISIDVKKIDKAMLETDDKGVTRLLMTLQLLPDGTVDQYGNLGVVTQKVPKKMRDADSTLRGNILGNGIEWARAATAPSTDTSKQPVTDDDLPF